MKKNYTKIGTQRYYKVIGVRNAAQATALRKSAQAKRLSQEVLKMTKWAKLSLRVLHMISNEAQQHLFNLWQREHVLDMCRTVQAAQEVYNAQLD